MDGENDVKDSEFSVVITFDYCFLGNFIEMMVTLFGSSASIWCQHISQTIPPSMRASQAGWVAILVQMEVGLSYRRTAFVLGVESCGGVCGTDVERVT